MNGSIYRGVVTKVIAGDAYNKVHPQVFITPIENPLQSEVLAEFSSIIPTNDAGSSFRSLPKVRQDCLVMILEGKHYIIGYISRTALGGKFTPEPLNEGAVVFGGAGQGKSAFKFDPTAGINLSVGMFTELDFDLLNQKITQKSNDYDFNTVGAYIKSTYNKKEDTHLWRAVYLDKKESNAFTDREDSLEYYEKGNIANLSPYVSKVVIEAGKIGKEGSIYKLETRQSFKPLIGVQDKNIFTSFRAGQQLEHTRDGEITWDGGTLLEFLTKYNVKEKISSSLQRIGKLTSGLQAGEVLRTQFYDNMNFSKLGVPLKEGEGWKYNPDEDAELVFIDSLGILSDKTIKRRFLSQKFSKLDKKDAFKYKEEFLGTGAIYLEHITYKDIDFKTNILQNGSFNYTYSNKAGEKSIFNEFFGPEGHAKIEIKDSAYTAAVNVKDGIIITYKEGDKTETISLKSDNLKITLSSEDSMEVKGKSFNLNVGKATLTIDETSFSLKVDKASLTIGADGKLLFNEQPLAFAEIINILLNDGAPGIGISGAPGSPAPLHPAVLAKITAGMAKPAITKQALFTDK